MVPGGAGLRQGSPGLRRRSAGLVRLGTMGGVALAVGWTGGCRDATSPFQAVDRVDESESLPRQLTFSAGDDRSPSWNGAGDRVLYATEGFPPFVLAPGLLLSLPAAGGAATELLPGRQFPGGPAPWFASPVDMGAAGILWVDLFGVRSDNLCPGTVVQCLPEGGTDGVAPRLAELRLRLAPAESGSQDQDRVLSVPVAGVVELPPEGGGTRFTVENHPAQRLFNAEGSAVFRPSPEPGGDRVAFSDGLRIRIWRPGAGESVAVPGTEDGVQAAWSPDGQWIAFTRLVRGEPEAYACDHFTPLGAVCTQERVEYPILDRRVVIVRPNGQDLSDVGPGDDPAWMPGSGRLVFRRDGRIWTSSVDGSDAREVEGTAGGREPAPSPDGTLLVFARLDPGTMSHNLWLVSLGGGS